MPLTVFYDGSCALCRSAARGLKGLRPDERLFFVDSSACDFEARLGDTPLPADIGQAIHVLDGDGRLYRGFDAVRRLLALAPTTRALAWLLGVPGVAPVGRVLYGLVSRHRHRLARPR